MGHDYFAEQSGTLRNYGKAMYYVLRPRLTAVSTNCMLWLIQYQTWGEQLRRLYKPYMTAILYIPRAGRMCIARLWQRCPSTSIWQTLLVGLHVPRAAVPPSRYCTKLIIFAKLGNSLTIYMYSLGIELYPVMCSLQRLGDVVNPFCALFHVLFTTEKFISTSWKSWSTVISPLQCFSDPANVLRNYLSEQGLITIRVSDYRGYTHGYTQPGTQADWLSVRCIPH